jgi:hypothetical protein
VELGEVVWVKAMKNGATGFEVMFQTLSSPVFQPIQRKLDEANKAVIV